MRLSRIQVNHAEIPERYSAVAFAVDGTLRELVDLSHPCPMTRNDWIVRPNVAGIMADYYVPRSHLRYAMITNQPGITEGHVKFGVARELLDYLRPHVFAHRPVEVYMCRHIPEQHCACRVPSPFHLLLFAHGHHIQLTKLLYVGAMLADADAADRAGIDFAWATDFFGW